MQTYDEIFSYVKAVVNRGDVFDSFIAQSIQYAGIKFERNRSMKYMESLVDTIHRADSTNPETVQLPSELKELRWVKLRSDHPAAEWKMLARVDGTFFNKRGIGTPEFYYVINDTEMQLNVTPCQDFIFRFCYYKYSSWPKLPNNSGGTGFQNWLTMRGADWLVAEAMLYLAPVLRNPELVGYWASRRDEAWKTLQNTDQRLEHGPKDVRMNDRRRGKY